MYLPPPAQWRSGRGRAHGLFVASLSLLNILVIFILYGRVSTIAWWLLLAFSAALSAHAAWRWWYGLAGLLRWTGEQWQWSQALRVPNPQACEIRWTLDFQSFVVIQMRLMVGAGPNHWMWLGRGSDSALAWLAMRRALVAACGFPSQSGAGARV